jgi:hypothetical protein
LNRSTEQPIRTSLRTLKDGLVCIVRLAVDAMRKDDGRAWGVRLRQQAFERGCGAGIVTCTRQPAIGRTASSTPFAGAWVVRKG